ncbi:NAD-dependent malic enzyme [Paenibacillus methanolicus]|uniref:Malate dehydrogenase (Oxaloacetate-decarboxylating) n=1 Tax=Paenibacillus methanolicus TaxID=582686 RepID=A0A5S5CGR9_9BACL|nr:NAD-dependent malic enzyme [Paenibacillus methanolicus]TYP78912.1 malate dehydrogenase (oxaloacetate-decarboxylating) [Paenibacillus methanolicus]
MAVNAGSSTNIIVRLEMDKQKIAFGQMMTAIGEAGGEVLAVDVSGIAKQTMIYDLTISLNPILTSSVVAQMNGLVGVNVIKVSDQTMLMHLGGKIEVNPKLRIKNRDDLSRVYTPGVARVSMAIHDDPSAAYSLTIKRNTVAVVSDGSAVLGLGNIGPLAAMPVMEGKAMLFKQLADVDAFPICIDTQDTEEIIETIKRIAPAFGGINLEDISSPRCFEIERRLIEELDIPVFHDDQHGTAVVLLAGLYNAVKLVGKRLQDCRVVLSGVGAAGSACTKILLSAGVTDIIGVDRCGALVRGQTYDHEAWDWYAEHTNPRLKTGTLSEVIHGADIFIGVSGPGVLTASDVRNMGKDPIVFAMANPTPEILPEEVEGIVKVMATGRSDYPNQINNVLCFPGLFRGVLDCRASRITEAMKLAAAAAIASVVQDHELNENFIIPSIFNQEVVERVRRAVMEVAYESGVARRRDLRAREGHPLQM